jgi:hypothetical protein
MKLPLVYIASIVTIALASAGTRAADTAPTSAPATAAASSEPSPDAVSILKMLEDRDQTLTDFSGKIRYEVYHPRTDDSEVNIGQVYYAKADGIAKFASHFVLGGASGAFQKIDQTLLFDGRWLIRSDAASKVFEKTELAPPGTLVKPLKLGEGPIPIPIGQDTQKVIHDFNVTIEPLDAKLDATDITHVKLIPRTDILRKNYGMARLELWVSKKLQLPIKLLREDDDPTGQQANVTTIALDNVQTNAGVPKVFDLPTPKTTDGWDVRIETLDKKKQ